MDLFFSFQISSIYLDRGLVFYEALLLSELKQNI